MKLKPLKKVATPPLMRKMTGTSLTSVGSEILLANVETVSEGEVLVDSNEGAMYNGSTMITIDLSRFAEGRGDVASWNRSLKAAACRSIALRIGLLRAARKETELRCAPRLIREMVTELEFTIVQDRLLVDIDIECPLAEPFEEVDDALQENQ